MRHEKLIEKHLGINTPDWVKEKVNNAIDEALGYNLKKSEELTPYIMYHNNGNVWIKGQKNSKGQQEGIEEWFYPNGNIKCRIPYKEGKINGIEERFNKQGNITKTRHWKNGELIETTKPKLTPYIEYDRNGNVWIKGQLNSKGQEEGLWEEFYPNGNIEKRTPYVGGEVDGILEGFYENGNIRIRIPYKEGKEDGIVEWFYSNGNTYRRTPYKEGKMDGIDEWFDEQGNITETYLWKNGEVIEETKH